MIAASTTHSPADSYLPGFSQRRYLAPLNDSNASFVSEVERKDAALGRTFGHLSRSFVSTLSPLTVFVRNGGGNMGAGEDRDRVAALFALMTGKLEDAAALAFQGQDRSLLAVDAVALAEGIHGVSTELTILADAAAALARRAA